MKRSAAFFIALFLIVSPHVSWANFYVVAAGKRAVRTILVSPKSTPHASGQALLEALASIDDNSDTRTYLIKIEPGIYDIGSVSLQMKEYVDVEGSGKNATVIKGSIEGGVEFTNGLVNSQLNCEIRNLKIMNTGFNLYSSIGIACNYPMRIDNVAIECTGTYVYGVFNKHTDNTEPFTSLKSSEIDVWGYMAYGVLTYLKSGISLESVKIVCTGSEKTVGVFSQGDSNIVLDNVKIQVSGASINNGIYIGAYDGKIQSNNVYINATTPGTTHHGVYNDGEGGVLQFFNNLRVNSVGYGIYSRSNSKTKVLNSSIQGSYYAFGGYGTVYIGSSQIVGGYNPSHSATYNCYGCYNQNMVNACP